MTALIDTSALIGLTDPDDEWQEWAKEQFIRLKAEGPVILLDIVYAETSAGMNSQDDMDTALSRLGLQRYANKDGALFLASRAMLRYRQHKKAAKASGHIFPPKRVLPDMLIGAVAEFEGIPLLTANAADFKKYFPSITLIAPPPKPYV